MKKNKIYLLIVFLVFVVISVVSITVMYFYQNYQLPNEFKTMTYNIDVTEEFNNDWGVKKVFITNSDSSNTDVVIRVKYIEIWSKTIDNQKLFLSNTINGINIVNKDWTSTFNNDFVNGGDGWYYYKKVLKPNEQIQILESISLNNDLIQLYTDYLDYDYQLIFSYEVLDTNVDLISDTWNKNIIINNDLVSWS